jgi:hypothetical protein
MSPPRSWPLHPQPGPAESLSSWLERTACLHGLPVKEMLTHNLGQPGLQVPELLDWDPPMVMLAALAERTGTSLAQLQTMTLAGWVPWLMDTLHTRPRDAQGTFENYIQQNSVLLAPGEAGRHRVSGRGQWAGPWQPPQPLNRVCPACATSPEPRRDLIWQLPVTTGCFEHGCRLEDARQIAWTAGAPPPVPVGEPLATLDRYTAQALTTGQVTLPGRTVHAGVWFRLLRSLLDEVSLALSGRSAHGRTTLEQIWHTTGRRVRAGLTTWRPYEHLDPGTQDAMRHAAATALHLAASRQITTRGTLGSAVQPPARQHVYDGDQPPARRPACDGGRPSAYQTAWQQAMAAAEAAVELARIDPGTARQLLTMLTFGCPSLARFEKERAYLSGIGIPAEFLPSARELGRTALA